MMRLGYRSVFMVARKPCAAMAEKDTTIVGDQGGSAKDASENSELPTSTSDVS